MEPEAGARADHGGGAELGDLDRRGKVDVPVVVTLTDEDGTWVAEMTVFLHLGRPTNGG